MDTSPALDNSPDELYKRTERVLAVLADTKDFALEVFKARQNFYERLILLNAGTLTLLFTVAGAIASANHASQLPIVGGHRLVTGCWLLIVSTIAALIHNWVNINALFHTYHGHLLSTLGLDMQRLEIEATRLAGKELSTDTLAEIQAKQSKAGRNATVTENICRVVGPAAQILTIWAFVEFVLALRSTLNFMVG